MPWRSTPRPRLEGGGKLPSSYYRRREEERKRRMRENPNPIKLSQRWNVRPPIYERPAVMQPGRTIPAPRTTSLPAPPPVATPAPAGWGVGYYPGGGGGTVTAPRPEPPWWYPGLYNWRYGISF